METGGNAKALEYLRKNGAIVNNNIDYKHSSIQKYKQDLNKKVIKMNITKTFTSFQLKYQVETLLKAMLLQENKILASSNTTENNNNNEKGNDEKPMEEKKVKEEPPAKPEEKFVCNLQNTSTQAKGFDVSFKKQ